MIWALIKVNVQALFSGILTRFRSKRRTKPGMAILIGLLAVYIIGSLFVSVGSVFQGMIEPFFEAGIGWFYFTLAGLFVFALCFVGSIFMVGAQVFNARDNELLLSMPIKPSVILTGRLSALLIVEYVFELIILIPVFAVLIMKGYISAVPVAGIIFFFLSSLLLPLFSLAVASFFAWIIALISSRLRKKNIITLILSLGFLGAYMFGYSRIMGYMNEMIAYGTAIADAVRRTVFPAYHMGAAIADGSFTSFLIFALCAVIPFVLMCALLSISFIKISTSVRGPKRVEYREKALRVSGAGTALLKREFGNYFASPMYIINSSLGAIATIIGAIVIIVRPGLITGVFEQFTVMLPHFDPELLGAVALSALAALNFVSAPSISLEGKTFWIVKSLPVSTSVILLSKAGLHLVTCGIPALLAGIIFIIRLHVTGIFPIILTIILPASITLTFSLIGLVLNITFPRFDWINPIQPVKQGLSSMLSMFGGMALILVLVLLYIFLPAGTLPPEIYLSLCTVFFLAVSAVLSIYLSKGGIRKFEAL